MTGSYYICETSHRCPHCGQLRPSGGFWWITTTASDHITITWPEPKQPRHRKESEAN